MRCEIKQECREAREYLYFSWEWRVLDGDRVVMQGGTDFKREAKKAARNARRAEKHRRRMSNEWKEIR